MSGILKMSAAQRWNWRTALFTVLAALVALLFLTNLYRLSAPWAPLAVYPNDDARLLNPELHRWHDAMWGAVSGILNGGVLLSLLWRPRQKPLLIQFVALIVIAGAATMIPFEPTLAVVILVVASVVAAYPAPRALVDISWPEPLSRPLLALSLAGALLLVPYMGRLLLWQIQGVGGEHATANQWISDVEHTAFLLIAMVLVSTKRPGWRTLGFLIGLVLLYLGVAALALPHHAGSWGVAGGILALIGGPLYIGATIRAARTPALVPAPAEV